MSRALRILLSGCWDIKYSGSDISLALASITSNEVASRQEYIVHGANAPLEWFHRMNIKTTALDWVEDYTDLLRNVDVQIFPIAIGTGTKGKVLSALAMGVACIGSLEAFANIKGQIGWPNVIYQSADEVGFHIQSIVELGEPLRQMTMPWTVRDNHASSKVAAKFWTDLTDD